MTVDDVRAQVLAGVAVATSKLDHVKPKLRGWLHAGAAPAALICGIVLVLLVPAQYKVAAAVYAASTVALFTVSATFHRGHWTGRSYAIIRRLDHSTIFLLIAGSYTPFAVALLHGASEAALLIVVWTGAVLGIIFRVFWLSAPRWLVAGLYLALGWAAVFFMPAFWQAGGAAVMSLIIAGGLCYTLGAVVYARRKPDPSPKWFGFHEVFHSFTLGGYVTHYIAVFLALFGVGAAATA